MIVKNIDGVDYVPYRDLARIVGQLCDAIDKQAEETSKTTMGAPTLMDSWNQCYVAPLRAKMLDIWKSPENAPFKSPPPAVAAVAEQTNRANQELLVAALDLINAIDENLDSKEPPRKYVVPWHHAARLRNALLKRLTPRMPS